MGGNRAELQGMSRTIALTASMWFLGSCVATDTTTVSEDLIAPRDGGGNVVTLPPNGTSLNGITLPPNGVSLNGINPTGLSASGAPIAISGTGAPLSGSAIVGSTWTAQVSNGTSLTIRIDQAVQGTGANADVWSYGMSMHVGADWQPLCHDASGNPTLVDSVSGTWNVAQGVPGGGSYHPNNSRFTLACRGSSIAKCVELGYKPWNGYASELAACVRALRADYCGDGTPYTVDGTLVNLFDDQGVRTDAIDWVPEAEWTADGARCISKKKETRFNEVLGQKPTCYPRTLKPEKSCGTGFGDGAVVITELAPE
jgi:hypothetical protein